MRWCARAARPSAGGASTGVGAPGRRRRGSGQQGSSAPGGRGDPCGGVQSRGFIEPVDRPKHLDANRRGIDGEGTRALGKITEHRAERLEVALDPEGRVAEAGRSQVGRTVRTPVRVTGVGGVEPSEVEPSGAGMALRSKCHGRRFRRVPAVAPGRRPRCHIQRSVSSVLRRVLVEGWPRLVWRGAHVSGGASRARTCPSFGSFHLPWFTSWARQRNDLERTSIDMPPTPSGWPARADTDDAGASRTGRPLRAERWRTCGAARRAAGRRPAAPTSTPGGQRQGSSSLESQTQPVQP